MGIRKRFRQGLVSVFGPKSSHIKTVPKNDVSQTMDSLASGQPSTDVVNHNSAEQHPEDIPRTSGETRSRRNLDRMDAENRPTAAFSTRGNTENRADIVVESRNLELGSLEEHHQQDIRRVEEESVQSASFRSTHPENNDETLMNDRKSTTVISERRTSNTETTLSGQSAKNTERAILANASNNTNDGAIVTQANDKNLSSGSSKQSQIAMFDGFQNTLFNGGTFVQNVMSGDRPGFKLLQKHVATSAFHNSAQRVDPPRCHPDTRITILKKIYDWIIESKDREKWLLWLNGAAGAGKSAIIQSTAERCVEAAIAIASFFFFRADSTRNAIAPLVATLAYQLIKVVPEITEDIMLTIERDPLIFDQSFESQLQHLLIQPLLRLPIHLQRLLVVFIDGLDECNDRDHQSNLIKILGNISRNRNSPIIFVIASRREPQIEAAFGHKHVSDLVLTLPLDNSDVEQASDDIRLFVTDKFNEIKETHLHRRLLPTDWPSASVVEEITSKSSGQFIYASVVVKYVSSPRANPARQLDVIRGLRLRDPSSHNPFAHLDALYQHIFSQVAELDIVLDILAFYLIAQDNWISYLEGIFLLEAGELEVYLADLIAVIQCDSTNDDVKFLHASLPDFLRDKSRSESYHIDVNIYAPKLLCMLLDRVPRKPDTPDPSNTVERQESFRIYAIARLLECGVKASNLLQRSFMNFKFMFYKVDDLRSSMDWATSILKQMNTLDFGDQGEAYDHVLEAFAVEFAKNMDRFDAEEKECEGMVPGLDARIDEILKEQAQA